MAVNYINPIFCSVNIHPCLLLFFNFLVSEINGQKCECVSKVYIQINTYLVTGNSLSAKIQTLIYKYHYMVLLTKIISENVSMFNTRNNEMIAIRNRKAPLKYDF